jgi:RNA polymerase sigma factor (sigma-70 family)
MAVGLRAEDLLRELTPRVLGALLRRNGDFEACEDAVQEALLAASIQWPIEGIPDSPESWLIRVASRRLIDEMRSDLARKRREAVDAAHSFYDPSLEYEAQQSEDDTLTILFLCCHPSLTPTSQVALTLRAVGGLTTAQIASAFLVSEASMAQRISRAKQRIRETGAQFGMPAWSESVERLRSVQHVLYLIFNEGYTASSGSNLQNVELTVEAIRLTRAVHRLLPADGELTGLLALMLLIDSRRLARVRSDGGLIPLAEQDRDLWNQGSIDEGIALITDSLGRLPLGPYQVQAAIAAVHAEAHHPEETDWKQILALYQLLECLAPSPMATLSSVVASAMVNGPQAGLGQLAVLDASERLSAHHRFHAVRAHLLEMVGDRNGARSEYLAAARLTDSLQEQRYLDRRAAEFFD